MSEIKKWTCAEPELFTNVLKDRVRIPLQISHQCNSEKVLDQMRNTIKLNGSSLLLRFE